MERA
ncbi:putative endopeptidase protein Rz, partial [Escherichia coli EC4013]|jgi:hypothetical protein